MPDDRNVLDYASPSADQKKSSLRSALIVNLVLQFGELMFSSTILDGGGIMRFVAIICFAQWVGVYLVLLRHRRHRTSPTPFDLAFIRYGSLMLIVFGMLIAPFFSAFDR